MIKEKLKELSQFSSVKLYPNSNLKNLYKGIGRVVGDFNQELLEVLKFTNGASILDYCLLGFKNSNLGIDMDKFVFELWESNDLVAGKVIGFMINSQGDTFGYLIDTSINKSPFSPIVYINQETPENLHVIGSSFNSFFLTFLSDIEYTIKNNQNDLLLSVERENWPYDKDHWFKNDQNLRILLKKMEIDEKEGILKLKL